MLLVGLSLVLCDANTQVAVLVADLPVSGDNYFTIVIGRGTGL